MVKGIAENEEQLKCRYCNSINVEPIVGKSGSPKTLWKCNDCEKTMFESEIRVYQANEENIKKILDINNIKNKKKVKRK